MSQITWKRNVVAVFLVLAWTTIAWAADPSPVLHVTDLVSLPRMISALCGTVMLLAVAGYRNLVLTLKDMKETNGKQWEAITDHGQRIARIEGPAE